MIIFSKILGNSATVWKQLRKSEGRNNKKTDLLRFSSITKPVVMWNLTRGCNLACKHCYLDAKTPHPNEWTYDEGVKLIDELAEMKIPVLIMTGGEPLTSPHFLDLSAYATSKGLRVVVSTNGTLIDHDLALQMKDAGIRYVGVSIDSVHPEVHDSFRGVRGSHSKALSGLFAARDVGILTGLRVTVHKGNWFEMPQLIDLCLREEIPRFCMYHLVPTGRGRYISDWDITPGQRRWVLDVLYDQALELADAGEHIEILSADSPMDGAYIIERLKESGDEERVEVARRLLSYTGGCSMGIKVANIDYVGNLFPCQFTPQIKLGNVRETSFMELWNHPSPELLSIREMVPEGKCGVCEYKSICKGCRQKAYYYTGSLSGSDPTCIYDPIKKKLVKAEPPTDKNSRSGELKK
ncbi:MAG: radical SAM protein [Methermicoccaceae archaeon]